MSRRGGPCSASMRAASPSRTPRTSIASMISCGVKARTTKPPVSSWVSSPSCASVGNDSRTGVLETPELACQLDFPDPLSRGKSALQDHLANFYDDS